MRDGKEVLGPWRGVLQLDELPDRPVFSVRRGALSRRLHVPRLHVGAVTPVLGSTSIETRRYVWLILSTCRAVAAAPHIRGQNHPTLRIDAATGSVSSDSPL